MVNAVDHTEIYHFSSVLYNSPKDKLSEIVLYSYPWHHMTINLLSLSLLELYDDLRS